MLPCVYESASLNCHLVPTVKQENGFLKKTICFSETLRKKDVSAHVKKRKKCVAQRRIHLNTSTLEKKARNEYAVVTLSIQRKLPPNVPIAVSQRPIRHVCIPLPNSFSTEPTKMHRGRCPWLTDEWKHNQTTKLHLVLESTRNVDHLLEPL